MQIYKTKKESLVFVKAVTWKKDSHSLFDYESTKTSLIDFQFPLSTKSLTFYRNHQTQQVVAKQNYSQTKNNQEYQMLTHFEIQPIEDKEINKVRLIFGNKKKPIKKPIHSDKVNTNQSAQNQFSPAQDTYLVIRVLKDINNQSKGYKLRPGQTLKLGRVQFLVSQVSSHGTINSVPSKSSVSRKMMDLDPQLQNKSQKGSCKICLQQKQVDQNYLFNPCKCSGSCGTVHIQCLMEWIDYKVKKQFFGGTIHYNFQKFDCQVCKTQLPMIIDLKGNKRKIIEMLSLEKPQGDYVILEGACEKSKSVMIIKNIGYEGIKLGRGHQCEIRIADISVSRNHALIKKNNGDFYVFDNKSKFGTLIREENMILEVGRQAQEVQIGKTVLTIDINEKKE